VTEGVILKVKLPSAFAMGVPIVVGTSVVMTGGGANKTTAPEESRIFIWPIIGFGEWV